MERDDIMSFLEIIYTLLIGPLQLIFEIIFSIANRMTGHPGAAIISLSLIMNFLVLPLYRRADAMQEEARDMELKLQKGVSHIKKYFSGDERMMILQTYYQQNHYKPTDALNGSISLLLEVPFFIAAYQFLSHLEVLQGVSFGPIADLGAPDGMLVLGGIAINILPILMTIVNIIASALYLKGFPLKTKIQLYAMALFFLVFLYTSPSGLVFYWTLNNLFSLAKNIFYKLKNPRKVLENLASIVGLSVLVYTLVGMGGVSLKGKIVFVMVGLGLQVPLLLRIVPAVKKLQRYQKQVYTYNKKNFVLGSLFLTLFIGVLIPSAVIAVSPMEFMDIKYYYNPLWYLVNSGCLAAGIFMVWMNVFYWLADNKGKALFDKIVGILCGIAVVNYMFFGTDMGLLYANLQYEHGMDWEFWEEIGNFLIVILVAVVVYFIIRKAGSRIQLILLTGVIAVVCMLGINVIKINEANIEIKAHLEQQTTEDAVFNLSKTGKNVIVFMLDRAMNQFVPYLFNEKPELKEQFAGFTYYPNTISYGAYTNFTVPSLFGGYEYTPAEINKRAGESLEEKHNEALKVMPAIFSDSGYEVTVCDPPYAGYSWIPDLSIYNELPQVKAFNTQGRFGDTINVEMEIKNNKRNFFCYGLMKSMPLLMQEMLYDYGRYNQADAGIYSTQTITDMSVSKGISSAFMDGYNVLLNLPEITKVTENDDNTFLMISNSATHEPMLLQEPEYEPSLYVDNTEYDADHKDRFELNGRKMNVENSYQMTHYQVNMATFIQLGRWFDYMRENDVYDNTRIILVADHGAGLGMFEDSVLVNANIPMTDLEYYYPLLMVKDFNSREYQVSDEFMTNADVPMLAMENVIDRPRNPYTGNIVDNSAKESTVHYIFTSSEWDTLVNNGSTFLPSGWMRFDGINAWDKNSWEFLEEKTILPNQ